MTRSIRTLEVTPLVAVASGGSFTFAYPAGFVASDFSLTGATLAIGDNVYPTTGLFSVLLGDDSAKVTLSGGASVAALTLCRLGLSELASPLDVDLSVANIKARTATETASFTLGEAHKGKFVHVNSASSVTASLPNNWRKNDSCVVRRVGAGAVIWAALSGATITLPVTKAAHIGVSERHEEIFLRVLANSDGSSAEWSILGSTA